MKGLKSILYKMGICFLLCFSLIACQTYQEIDFQSEKCKQAPSADIDYQKASNTQTKQVIPLRYEFSLKNVVQTNEQAPIQVIWLIDGQTFSAQKVSYQFDAPNDNTVIKVQLFNRCLMEKDLSITIKIN